MIVPVARVKTIAHDPEIIVFEIGDLTRPRANLNVDVEVHDDAGRWSATFFTLANVDQLVRRDGYLWAADIPVR
jgi:hypothetical protein